MSLVDLDLAAARAGRIDCVCDLPAGEGPEDRAGAERNEIEREEIEREETWRLSLSFGLAVLAQALLLAVLPIAGAVIATRPSLANLPYALTLLGAALASLPASLLLDRFGRRAAFALGASLGTAGGLLAGWAAMSRHFPELCVGALWLGMAQGFALFYRHAAAMVPGRGSRAALSVLAGGCVASLAVPATIALARYGAGPYADAALMLVAGLASLAALPLMLSLPRRLAAPMTPGRERGSSTSFWIATAAGAFAWFSMAHVMAGAPSALIGCGLGVIAMGGLVSWHLIAMYGPMALVTRRREMLPTPLMTGAGLALLGLAIAMPREDAVTIELLLILGGVGWSLVQIGASRLLYDEGVRSRLAFALHDVAILGAALLGASSAIVRA